MVARIVPGRRGPAGAKGRSIVSTNITVDNHLVIAYDDGSTEDAGLLPAGGGGGGGGGPVAAADITDSTVVGRNVLKATDQAAARSAISAGTSSQTLSAMSGGEANTGTATTLRGITADVLKAAIETHAPDATLADGAVSTAKLADGAATLAKLANVATARILARLTAGTGPVEALTVAQFKQLLALTIADMPAGIPMFVYVPAGTTTLVRPSGEAERQCWWTFESSADVPESRVASGTAGPHQLDRVAVLV